MMLMLMRWDLVVMAFGVQKKNVNFFTNGTFN